MDELEGAPNIQVITLILDADDTQPKIDLGNVHPYIAYALFTKALGMLDEIMSEPEITYAGDIISPQYYEFSDDSDDDDDE